jgi:hypothetical protein
LQPHVHVVGGHGDLKVLAIHVEPRRRMRRQTAVVIGVLDQILGAGALVV